MEKLKSIDLKAPLGFLKKPDINEGIYLTFNMLHKPALLGILGAIVGLSGYRRLNELPEYYRELIGLPVGIQPLNTSKGNFTKTVVQYNNGVGYASHESGGNLIVAEQVLIQPTYRCYLLLNSHNSRHQQLDAYLQQNEAEYLPYLGKNEFSLWWDAYQEYDYEPFAYDRDYKVETIFRKAEQLLKDLRERSGGSAPFIFAPVPLESEFLYFEELPVGFDKDLMQYQRETFAYTNFTLRKERKLDGLYHLKEKDVIVQLF